MTAMLLHLTAPATGARLAVCDAACARHAAVVLAHLVATVTDLERSPSTHCVRCVVCGGIIDEPIGRPCLWHPGGCPAWEYTYTLAGAQVALRLTTPERPSLDDTAMRLIEGTAVALTSEGLPADPDLWYLVVEARLAPPAA